jgi:hypothetical protein
MNRTVVEAQARPKQGCPDGPPVLGDTWLLPKKPVSRAAPSAYSPSP